MNKFTITLYSLNQLDKIKGYDFITGYYVGSSKFCLRPTHDFSIDEIKEVRQSTEKKIFVNVNKLFHEDELKDLEEYLIEISKLNVDYVVFGDFAVYEINVKYNLNLNLIYSTETTITNQYYTFFANDFGINGVELAKEITLKEIKEISENKQSLVSINVQGHLYMYQSVRNLLTNYSDVIDKEIFEGEYYLYDEERENYYPIIENEQGTHILASNDVTLIHKLDKILELDIDFLKIDTYAYKENDVIILLEIYKKALQLINDNKYRENSALLLEELKNSITYKTFDTGFYFKRTTY